jgi:hypothetical protein
MPEALITSSYDLKEVTRSIVTEDDTPVDNFFSAKQRRLLVEPLYSSWQPPPLEDENEAIAATPRKFLVDTDVGIFTSPYKPPIDVETNPEYFSNEHRAYFVWEFEKIPEVAVEIVSTNRKGNEIDAKLGRYAHLGVTYYVVFDPFLVLSKEKLQIYELGFGRRYRPRHDLILPDVGLSLQLWLGNFEGATDEWLRWCDMDGNLIPTGSERARAANAKVEVANERANIAEWLLATETERTNAMEVEFENLRAELQLLKS